MSTAVVGYNEVEAGAVLTNAPARTFALGGLRDGEVEYFPFIGHNGQVGYQCKHDDGRVEYLYFNPSTDDGFGGRNDGPGNNVFVYQGTDGDPSEDGPHNFYYVFNPEDWEEPDGINA